MMVKLFDVTILESFRSILCSKHSHKKQKNSLKKWAVLLISSLEFEILGWLYRAYIKTATNGDFREELLSENDFEAALATVFRTMAPRFLRQFRRSRQIKKTITNAPRKL